VNQSINSPGDGGAARAPAGEALLAADAGDIQRLLAWYYGCHDPSRRHIRVRSHLEGETVTWDCRP